MTYEVVPFYFLKQIYKGVERDALWAMFRQIAPQVCAEDCLPYLAIGKKYTTEASFENAWVTTHLYPHLCATVEEATACLRPYFWKAYRFVENESQTPSAGYIVSQYLNERYVTNSNDYD